MVWLVTQEPVILECKVKWALRSTAVNKASGCDEIPVELFKFLKNDAIKVLHSLCQQTWKTQEWPGKGQSSSQFPRRVVPKNVLTIGQLHSSPMLVTATEVAQSDLTLCDPVDYILHP